jgi:hypothetical protein
MAGEPLFLMALVVRIDVVTLSPGGGFGEQRATRRMVELF